MSTIWMAPGKCWAAMFQIHSAPSPSTTFTGLAAAGKDYLKQTVHFLGDFLLDRFGRFFSSGVKASSTGRSRQICSLTPTSSWPSFW